MSRFDALIRQFCRPLARHLPETLALANERCPNDRRTFSNEAKNVDLLIGILAWAVFGLIVGAIARLLVPGRQSMSLLLTMVLGVVGSLAGGFLAWLISGGAPLQASGWLMSTLGAVLVLAVYLTLASRSHA
jgi:uncharacterized membrane protein YeaQ/YmgE (transglycosylase-associated protein family)